ncbi:MAG: hypothetical protein NC349_01955 [Paenibacillus sp.]|nr:hypothetical protein [Paenibacillus sp.]
MDENLNRILTALKSGEPVGDPDELRELLKEYPFFVLPAVLALKHQGAGMDASLKRELMEQIALNSPDPQRAFMLADVDYEEWVNFYPRRGAEVSTNDAITKFLETYGHSDPREEALLERLIFNPTPDYSSMLAREEETDLPSEPVNPDDNSQDALINAFILKHRDDEAGLLPREDAQPSQAEEADKKEPEKAEERHTPSHASSPAYDTSLSESLAKIYIRQKRYDKAFEIIHTLSLNNPKKSAYFADQLRFLKKLMLNRGMANNSK